MKKEELAEIINEAYEEMINRMDFSEDVIKRNDVIMRSSFTCGYTSAILSIMGNDL